MWLAYIPAFVMLVFLMNYGLGIRLKMQVDGNIQVSFSIRLGTVVFLAYGLSPPG